MYIARNCDIYLTAPKMYIDWKWDSRCDVSVTRDCVLCYFR